MITATYCRTMARYNAWQNQNLMEAASALAQDALTQNRGAFFGSILETFNHVLWGDLTWFSGLSQSEETRPLALCVTHVFNHQIHHRGQIHAMLTAAGAHPHATDLIFLPSEV